MQTLIHNACLVLPDHLVEHGWLLMEDEHILDLGDASSCPHLVGQSFDARNHFLLPGLIDVHCDAIERLVEPRPNVHFDLPIALQEADLRLAGCGITCEFHAISLDDNEFGVRSDTFVHDLRQSIVSLEDNLLIRHKIHARLELSSERATRTIAGVLERRECDLVSLMDHSPGQGQYRDVQSFREYVARTTHKSEAEIDAVLQLKHDQRAAMPARIELVTRLAHAVNLTVATHDDDDSAKIDRWLALGIRISEFPTTFAAAQRAHESGLAVCMGAPNALRGKSSGGNLSALVALRAGVTDILCSDYYPSALLGAVFSLASSQILSLPAAVRLVTLNPARAVGLHQQYGTLEAGKAADLVLVRCEPVPADTRSSVALPRVLQTFVAGQQKLTIASPS